MFLFRVLISLLLLTVMIEQGFAYSLTYRDEVTIKRLLTSYELWIDRD